METFLAVNVAPGCILLLCDHGHDPMCPSLAICKWGDAPWDQEINSPVLVLIICKSCQGAEQGKEILIY